MLVYVMFYKPLPLSGGRGGAVSPGRGVGELPLLGAAAAAAPRAARLPGHRDPRAARHRQGRGGGRPAEALPGQELQPPGAGHNWGAGLSLASV